MSTNIQWTNETWNPTRGCSKVSEGCRNCYAMRQAHRFSGPGQPYEGLTHIVPGKGAQWTGKVTLAHDALGKPLRWRKPRRVFVDSMSDLFHPDVPFEFVDQVFGVMAMTSMHTYQVLTKRLERMAEYVASRGAIPLTYHHPVQQVIEYWIHQRPTPEDAGLWSWPPPNVWLGTSVEDQAAADERIPHLLRCPASVRFLSCEPLLGPVDVSQIRDGETSLLFPLAGEGICDGMNEPRPLKSGGVINWVIAGGESGPGARPCDVGWIRSIVQQCQAAGVPAFVKQLGAHPFEKRPAPLGPQGTDEALAKLGAPHPQRAWFKDWCLTHTPDGESAWYRNWSLRDRKGGDPAEWPEDLRVREFPGEVSHAHG